MKIKFIGTGSGKTSLKRFHSSFMIQSGSYNLLVDTGDGISKALLSAGIELNTISSILYTHMHPDHAAGLPSFIVQQKMLKRKDELLVYCHSAHPEQLAALLNSTHIYPSRLEFKLEFKTFLPGGITDTGKGIRFRFELNTHLKDLDKNPEGINPVSCSFLFSLDNKQVFYTGDIGEEVDLYKFRDEKIDIMIAESTHVPVENIIKASKELGAEYLYLTHISDDEDIPVEYLGTKIIAVNDKDEINI
jgi:ribonuclease BN (tRNA processing enzyme)